MVRWEGTNNLREAKPPEERHFWKKTFILVLFARPDEFFQQIQVTLSRKRVVYGASARGSAPPKGRDPTII
jgi:hypothetical protein